MNQRSPKAAFIWSVVWFLFSIFNLDISWGNFQLHRTGIHGLFTDKERLIFWSFLLVFFFVFSVQNGLRWRKERALTDGGA